MKPHKLYNPAIQRLYQCVRKRAYEPGSELPPLDPNIAKILDPMPELFTKHEAEINRLKELFPLLKTGTHPFFQQ